MILSHKKKFIYFACGKSGTTAIEKLLGKYHDDHVIMARIEKELQALRQEYNRPFTTKHVRPEFVKNIVGEELWVQYFKFTFVRNPWDWLISQFCYNFEYLSRTLYKFDKKHFDAIWYLLKLHNQSLYTDNYHQYTFVMDEKGKQIIDYIGKYENLQDDFNQVCSSIGIKAKKIPILNPTIHCKYRDLYTEETRKLVTQHYQYDIEIFGYEF